jgi:hypothetical protein
VLALIALAGCQREEIAHYQVERADPNEARVRIFGAIIPIDNNSAWFFKYTGSLSLVGRHEGNLRTLIGSVKFADDKREKIDWTLPEGWKAKREGEIAFATFVLPDRTEATVSKLGGGVPANINRWRDQVGLPKLPDAEVEKTTTKMPLAQGEAIVVDVSGPGPKGGGGMGGGAPAEPPFVYELPESWRVAGQAKMSSLTLTAGDAQLTVTSAGGSLEANVNRWRGQVGLGAASDEDIRKAVQARKIGGRDSQTAELVGADRTILVAIVPQDKEQLFIKLTGLNAAVAAQKAAFDRFLQSIKFEGDRGANDGK